MLKFALFFFIVKAAALVYWGYSKGKIKTNKEYLEYDRDLYQHIQITDKALALFYRQYNHLPETLGAVQEAIITSKSDNPDYLDFLDGFNKFDVNYKTLTPSSYEICAYFYKNYSDQALAQTPDRFARFKKKKELYKKGNNCFKVTL